MADGYIEARPKGVSKGLFINHAIATMKANNYDPDFILAIGTYVCTNLWHLVRQILLCFVYISLVVWTFP